MAALHRIKRLIGVAEKLFNRLAMVGVNRRAYADRKPRIFAIHRQTMADSSRGLVRAIRSGFRKNQSKFVAAVSCGGVDGAGMRREGKLVG